ncbi:PQQ-dependent sugar dehydrogenase [Pannus brasiliensis CCIBt3594]|uniref:PQQ-dependent sugar dehydrogenase n=1 Tax=Pannus brasiliensis CCIBt3594 TaxID=1427578 RepID=A0AAW9QUL6_9CHRO
MLVSIPRISWKFCQAFLAIVLISACEGNVREGSIPGDSSATRNAAIPAKAEEKVNVRQVTVIEGLEHPWGMAWLPSGEMLITERPGRLRVVRGGKLDPTPIAGVPEVFAVGQGGLLDVAVHPDFARNRLIYFTYAYGNESANRTRVARAVFDGKRLRDVRVIFEVSRTKTGSQHFGSRLLWLWDGTLLVSIGDGGNPPLQFDGKLSREQAQNRAIELGKIVRIEDDGSIPKDNPFPGSKIWSYGHRNIQGLAIDPTTGRVWSTEHGAKGGDELNLIEKGKNYGWPIISASRDYRTGEPVSEQKSRPGMVDPKWVWTPAIAPSGLAFYTGNRFPAWRGDLFAGGLVARSVIRIDRDASGKVSGQQSIEIGQRVRDVRQGPDGFLYILTDEENGRLIRLEPK